MSTPHRFVIPALALLLVTGRVEASSNLLVYDDALQNAFENYSYGGQESLTHTSTVHAGAYSVSFVPRDWGALSFYSPVVLSTTDYQGLEFWVHGGAGGGQSLELAVTYITDSNQEFRATAPLQDVLGSSIPANTWVRVQVSFDTGPMAFSGTFNRFWLQDAAGSVQPTVYFDDFSVVGRATTSPEPEPEPEPAPAPAPAPEIDPNAMLIERDVTAYDGMVAERFTWKDRSGQSRSATFPHNTGQTGPGGTRGGELREYTYQVGTATRTVRAPSSAYGGFGYVVSHMEDPSMASELGVNDSPLGHFFTGEVTRVLQGRHHAIHRFTQYYPRYGRESEGAPVSTYQVPVTVEWFIASGQDHPLWSISYDLSVAPVNVVSADSRAPYGELLFDGASSDSTSDTIGGVGWGDKYKFTSTTSPVTMKSGWKWNTANTIPYLMLWKQSTDAEMGVVLTRTLAQQDAGGYYGYYSWGRTSSNGKACNFGPGNSAGVDPPMVHLMPCAFNWPFQSINYQLYYDYYTDTVYPTNNNRIAWGTNVGFLGKAQYPEHGCGNWDCSPMRYRSGYPRQSYSTYVVLGQKSKTAVSAQVKQVESAQLSTLTASVGSVRTQGPAGVGRTDLATYSPAGYNHVYATWDVSAVNNDATVTLNAGGAGLERPIFVLHGYTSTQPPTSVTLDGTALVADSGYYATVDSARQRLFVTINTLWTGSRTLAITAP